MGSTLVAPTAAQLRNLTRRKYGESLSETYHTQVGPGDQVSVTLVTDEPFAVEKFTAFVGTVDDHGWYIEVELWQFDGNEAKSEADVSPIGHRKVTLYRDGPGDWGAVEFMVIRKKHHQVVPTIDGEGGWAWQKLRRQENAKRREKRAREKARKVKENVPSPERNPR